MKTIEERKQTLSLITCTVAGQLRRLANASSLESVLEIRSAAAAAAKLAQSARLSVEVYNQAAELRIRSEAKAGRALSALKLRGGNRKCKSNNQIDCLKLEHLGVSQNESTRWQRIGRICDERLDAYFCHCNREHRESTVSGLLRFAQKAGMQSAKPLTTKKTPPDETFVDLLEAIEILSKIWGDASEDSWGPVETRQIPRYLQQLADLVDSLNERFLVQSRRRS